MERIPIYRVEEIRFANCIFILASGVWLFLLSLPFWIDSKMLAAWWIVALWILSDVLAVGLMHFLTPGYEYSPINAVAYGEGRAARLTLVLLNLPVFIPYGLWRLSRAAGRVLLTAWRDRTSPYAPLIRRAKNCLRTLREEGVNPEAIAKAETALALLRDRHRVETVAAMRETARLLHERRIMTARDGLLAILAEAEADNDPALLEASKEAVVRLPRPSATNTAS